MSSYYYKKAILITALIILGCLLLLRVYTAIFNAQVNFDFFFYLGVAHHFFGDTSISSLEFVQQTVQDEMPWYDLQKNVYARPYGYEVWTNAEAFAKQIPYYSIKPIYPILIQGLHMAGLEYLQASVLISVVSYTFMISMVVICVRHGLPAYSAAPVLAALVVSFYQPIYTFARFSTPDMLNACILVLSAYTAFRLDRWWLAFGIGFLAIYIRPDSILWIGALWVAYVSTKGINFRNMAVAGLAVLAGLVFYYSIRLIDEPYSIFLLQKIFFSPLDASSAHPDSVTDIYNLSEILNRYRNATLGLLQERIGSTQYLWMIALAATGIFMSFRLSQPAERVWFIAPLAAMLVFHLVMPKEHDRNLIYAYIIILIGWARLLCHAPKPRTI